MGNKPFIDSRLSIQWVPLINGWGVFTNSEIPAGIIIERAPLIIYPNKITDMTYWLLQAEGIKSETFILDRYMIKWGDSSAIPLGWCGLYNHSDNNNVMFQPNYENECIEIRTISSISANEQCLVHYGSGWFEAKGYVKKIDF